MRMNLNMNVIQYDLLNTFHLLNNPAHLDFITLVMQKKQGQLKGLLLWN